MCPQKYCILIQPPTTATTATANDENHISNNTTQIPKKLACCVKRNKNRTQSILTKLCLLPEVFPSQLCLLEMTSVSNKEQPQIHYERKLML